MENQRNEKEEKNAIAVVESSSEKSDSQFSDNKKLFRFRYGNFDRYYGCRIERGSGKDPRLSVFKKEWFEKKSVLDIGCNAGYITLWIAREFSPNRILGIDIDAHLVGVARKNIRHYCDKSIEGNFPASFAHRYGPVSAPPVSFSTKFPDNVWFRQENYVLEHDEYLDAVKEEFDVILALSITKWIHINWGDDGLKRFFRRIYLHLRPGGKLILEPQDYKSYYKRAKLTVSKTLSEKLGEFLLKEVGFTDCENIEVPKAKSKGHSILCQISYSVNQTLTQ
ncbi:unnamed protein product [Enterobius vermicularis]|uniref:RNA methyltransferase n=1 Tax=Enterobius vermicularis TaxID=51028 RepID=A0A0N4UXD5_ENTVE|nr:unnamed protein product [Enterobius vermicularis]